MNGGSDVNAPARNRLNAIRRLVIKRLHAELRTLTRRHPPALRRFDSARYRLLAPLKPNLQSLFRFVTQTHKEDAAVFPNFFPLVKISAASFCPFAYNRHRNVTTHPKQGLVRRVALDLRLDSVDDQK